MKLRIVSLLALGMVLAPGHAQNTNELSTLEDKVSYGIGMSIGNSFKRQAVSPQDVKVDVIARGIRDALQGNPTLMSEEQMAEVLNEFQGQLRTRQAQQRDQSSEKNKQEGQAFLEQNKSRPGVKVLPSGIQYEVQVEGTGKSPDEDDTVTVHYRGTLIDGTEFDSSHKRGQPATFQLNRVIPGWTESLQHMKEGGKWKIFIPSDLAYGERGSGQIIGPNATLIFEVELISVQENTPKPSEPVTSDIIKVPSAEELKKGAKIEVIKKDELDKERQELEKKNAQPKK